MPTYEYRREDGTTFEVWQGINDEPLEQCPETGQKVKRVITGGGGVVYKGDGWYVTDYKNKDRPDRKEDKSDSSTESGDTTSGKNENSGKADTGNST